MRSALSPSARERKVERKKKRRKKKALACMKMREKDEEEIHGIPILNTIPLSPGVATPFVSSFVGNQGHFSVAKFILNAAGLCWSRVIVRVARDFA